MSTTLHEYLEKIIADTGGFGRFQLILTFVIFGGKMSANWSMIMMTFGGAVPKWTCNHNTLLRSLTYSDDNETNLQSCYVYVSNASKISCGDRIFDTSMNTVASEVGNHYGGGRQRGLLGKINSLFADID